jgi:hypothetical protein
MVFAPKDKLFKLPKQPPKLLDLEQIDALFNAASVWLKPILLVLLNTGLDLVSY